MPAGCHKLTEADMRMKQPNEDASKCMPNQCMELDVDGQFGMHMGAPRGAQGGAPMTMVMTTPTTNTDEQPA